MKWSKAAADKYPKNYAYEFMGKKTTYAEFMQKIDAGRKGTISHWASRRATASPSACRTARRRVDSFYALNRIGAVSNMIHPLSAAGEIKFYLNFSQSKAILTLDQFYGKIAPDRAGAGTACQTMLIAQRSEDELLPASGHRLRSDRRPQSTRSSRTQRQLHSAGPTSLAVGAKKPESSPARRTGQSHEDGASILYSGGTTGTTKGILLSNLNFNAPGPADHRRQSGFAAH